MRALSVEVGELRGAGRAARIAAVDSLGLSSFHYARFQLQSCICEPPREAIESTVASAA